MRLIIANQHLLPSPAPESLQVINTAASLAKICDVHLLSGRGDDEPVDKYYNLQLLDTLHIHYLKGFRIDSSLLRITWNLPFYISSLIRILKLTRKYEVDAVLVRNLKLGYCLLKWRRLFKLPPIIFETHEIFTQSFQDEMKIKGRTSKKGKRLAGKEAFVYENADGLICITRHLAEMIQAGFKTKGQLLIAPDGVDLAPFNKKNPDAADNGMKPEKTLLYLGSLHHWKGLDVLIKAMRHLPDTTSLLIVGGNQETIKYYQTIAEQLEVKKRVRFEGFVLPGKRFEYIFRADICILPLKPLSIANYFTSPLKLFEYMASGKPIVASDLPAIREVLSHKINSILVTPDNPEALAGGIRSLIDNPALGRTIAGKALEDVREYTWDRRAEKIVNFIQSCRRPTCAE